MKVYTNDLDGFIKNIEALSIESTDRNIIMMCDFTIKTARKFKENNKLQDEINNIT